MDDIGCLIRYAGERENVSHERMERARARVGDHWQSVVESNKQSRRRVHWQRFAMAASIVAALSIGLLTLQPGGGGGISGPATVDRVVGSVYVNGARVSEGVRIGAGDVVASESGGRLAIELPAGQSLRLDANSRLVAKADNRFTLERGSVYFDSNLVNSEPVFIETPFGTATDVGTQFLVSVQRDLLMIGVREGQVMFDRDDAATVNVDFGRMYELTSDGDERRQELSATNPVWAWTSSVAPAFDADGAMLSDYLRWYARQQGLSLAWEDSSTQAYAERTTLSGDILRGLSLDDGLDVVRRIAPFEYRIERGRLIISER